jgi:outer membrane receptor protein involved in Fe transport
MEDLLKGTKWIDMLALRFSYGLQGNMLNNQPNKLSINKGNYSTKYASFISTVKDYPNLDLKWEKTHSYNVGIDFSFLKNKINGSLAYYYKKTTDAFLSRRVATVNGVSSYTINAGELENQGVEIALNFTPINNALSSKGKRGFTWRIDPQIGQTLNRFLNDKINQNNKVLQDAITLPDLYNGTAYVAGEPMNTFYSFRFNGLDGAGNATFKGLELERQAELTKLYDEMDLLDRKNVWFSFMEKSGTRVPTFQGGVNNYVGYRNFSFTFNLAYSLGNKVRLFKIRNQLATGGVVPHVNMRKEFVYRWRRPGDENDTDIPGITSTADGWWRNKTWSPKGSNGVALNTAYMYDNSDIRVANGDYLRMQSMIFRYTFDKDMIKRLGMSNAYISFSATNLFTLCDDQLKGQDPEQFGAADVVNISVRPTYSMSLNVNF